MSINQFISDLLDEQYASDTDLQKKMRYHQSWWRVFVLGEDPGQHPLNPRKRIGSCIYKGKDTGLNFLDKYALRAITDTLSARKQGSKGLINEERLFNNLLSSQPLCFNFFGRLKYNLPLATKVFQQFYSDIIEITNIHFEYAPKVAFNGDNSAHDVALEFISHDNKNGLIGLECKYTEAFSPNEYSKNEYLKVYEDSKAFSASYEELINTQYNQLFRNQLIIESALVNNCGSNDDRYEIGYSGLFCYQEDHKALSTGKNFQKMLKHGEERFKIITFADLIEKIQKIDIDWETREWSMMLWARYCGTELSKRLKR